MKRILLTIAITVIALSCKKENKSCWKCKTIVSYNPSSAGTTTTTENQVCDKTRDQIEDYMKAGSYTTTSGNITVRSATVCSQR